MTSEYWLPTPLTSVSTPASDVSNAYHRVSSGDPLCGMRSCVIVPDLPSHQLLFLLDELFGARRLEP